MNHFAAPVFSNRERKSLAQEWRAELKRITDWWIDHAFDREYGGFFGQVGIDGVADREAPKRAIMQARFCWFYSTLAAKTGDRRMRDVADTCRDFLLSHIIDPIHGGAFWEVTRDGSTLSDRKHAYCSAFTLYALASHYSCSRDAASAEAALSLFDTWEAQSFVREHDGYWEARARDWTPLKDVRLSEHDLDASKSMNTHLHILEAYSELYAVLPSERVGKAVSILLKLHCERVFNRETGHLRLFWNDDWQDLSTAASFGHDIEASWLIWLAAERLDDLELKNAVRPIVLELGRSTLERGVGAGGQTSNERMLASDELDETGIWWVQAEAMVGHLNAWKISGDSLHWRRAVDTWKYTKDEIVDDNGGEWRWYASSSGKEVPFWGGPWKGNYHNGRALMECLNLIDETVIM